MHPTPDHTETSPATPDQIQPTYEVAPAPGYEHGDQSPGARFGRLGTTLVNLVTGNGTSYGTEREMVVDAWNSLAEPLVTMTNAYATDYERRLELAAHYHEEQVAGASPYGGMDAAHEVYGAVFTADAHTQEVLRLTAELTAPIIRTTYNTLGLHATETQEALHALALRLVQLQGVHETSGIVIEDLLATIHSLDPIGPSRAMAARSVYSIVYGIAAHEAAQSAANASMTSMVVGRTVNAGLQGRRAGLRVLKTFFGGLEGVSDDEKFAVWRLMVDGSAYAAAAGHMTVEEPHDLNYETILTVTTRPEPGDDLYWQATNITDTDQG